MQNTARCAPEYDKDYRRKLQHSGEEDGGCWKTFGRVSAVSSLRDEAHEDVTSGRSFHAYLEDTIQVGMS